MASSRYYLPGDRVSTTDKVPFKQLHQIRRASKKKQLLKKPQHHMQQLRHWPIIIARCWKRLAWLAQTELYTEGPTRNLHTYWMAHGTLFGPGSRRPSKRLSFVLTSTVTVYWDQSYDIASSIINQHNNLSNLINQMQLARVQDPMTPHSPTRHNYKKNSQNPVHCYMKSPATLTPYYCDIVQYQTHHAAYQPQKAKSSHFWCWLAGRVYIFIAKQGAACDAHSKPRYVWSNEWQWCTLSLE